MFLKKKGGKKMDYVIKRNGQKEEVHFDKITTRLTRLCYGLDMNYVNVITIARKVIEGLKCGIHTYELDNLASETAASFMTQHPDYGTFAARIAVSNLHKETNEKFSEVCTLLFHAYNEQTNRNIPMLSEKCYHYIMENKDILDKAILTQNDFEYDYFGFKTLCKSYLLRINGKIVERPQHLLMRVAVGFHMGDMTSLLETYRLLSEKWFTHATPTLFNSCTPNNQLASCFLMDMQSDSITGIYNTLGQAAQLSKYAGGIGLALHKIRAKGSYIAGTHGESRGLVPLLRVFNATMRYVDQGGGKRLGSLAPYLEPWHADIFDFLDLKKNTGIEENRARDLFYALWIPDLFMQRVESDGSWSLFCPHEAPGLNNVWGSEFKELYEKYESMPGKSRKVIQARTLWNKILEIQTETGTPYMLYKDACNSKSNHQHLGTIQSSNLCTEIIQYTSPDEIAVCNLASICLPKFVSKNVENNQMEFNFGQLFNITCVATRNLDKGIDVTFYPVKEAEVSNKRHRAIGLGIQGLADTFILMRYPFDSPEAALLNKQIFETMYFAACYTSNLLAMESKSSYDTFEGSPMSKGFFQFDLWSEKPCTNRYDWETLRENIMTYGMKNSLLIAPMPSASTSQILGNSECFEPYTSNLFIRKTLSGEFIVIVKQLMIDLMKEGLWTDQLRNELIANNGSVQSLNVPQYIKNLYKTAWEISGKTIIDLARGRAPYICQSQSMSVFMKDPTPAKLTSFHFYSWKSGLKTGMYYLRMKASTDAIKFTVDQELLNTQPSKRKKVEEEKQEEENMVCRREEGCVMCSS